ncbi:MAG: agmatinase [Candidatus Bathyarchaeota archaeon]|nr:agmatinase [Candidatus Bathyarchaeota archaeon]
MSNIDLFVSQSNVFNGIHQSFDKTRYAVFGVPFDVTSTYRTGARFAPTAIRQASLNIETYSLRSDYDTESLPLIDLGDLHVSSDPKKTINILNLVAKDLFDKNKIPVAIGGEHTITLGILKGLESKSKKTAVVVFDAHLDLRKEFLGLTLSHTTFMRLVNERIKPAKIIEVGTRATCKEELDYSRKAGIEYITSHQIREQGSFEIIKEIKNTISSYENVYLSIDMDVLDPAYAPGVQNPEPEGIETHTLIDILCSLCDNRVIGFDVVEVAPIYDHGLTAITASKIIFELLSKIEKKSN